MTLLAGVRLLLLMLFLLFLLFPRFLFMLMLRLLGFVATRIGRGGHHYELYYGPRFESSHTCRPHGTVPSPFISASP